jgi:hypothetical protein
MKDLPGMLAIASFLETPFFVPSTVKCANGLRPGPVSIWWTLLAVGCRHRFGCGQLCRFGRQGERDVRIIFVF